MSLIAVELSNEDQQLIVDLAKQCGQTPGFLAQYAIRRFIKEKIRDSD